MALPKTPIVATVLQVFAFVFGILILIPGNGVMEDAYIMSMNTSKMGHDSLVNSNTFTMNNSNPLFVAITNTRPNFDGVSHVMSGLNDAIMARLEMNMSNPKTAERFYNTSVRDAIRDGKELIHSERGQTKIASGIADFLNGMVAQMKRGPPSNPTPPSGPPPSSPPPPKAPMLRSRRRREIDVDRIQEKVAEDPEKSVNLYEMLESLERNALSESGPQDIQASHVSSKRQLGQEKPQPPIPQGNPWAPLQKAFFENAPIISVALKKGAIQGMNAQMEALRKAVPIYDFYSIYNSGICWGFYKSGGARETIGCGSSSDWKDVDITPNVQRLVQLQAPDAKLVGRIGLGNHAERLLGAMRVMAMIAFVTRLLAIISLAFSMVGSVVGIIAASKGWLPAGKVVRVNFLLSMIAVSNVAPNGLGTLISFMASGIITAPMNDMQGIQVNLGWGFLALVIIGMVFSIAGTVAWHRMSKRLIKLGEEARAEVERQRADSFEHGQVTEVMVAKGNKF
ncbi:hypothetical protein EJ08DRAFT_677247 [Tothia fuscella]|uniref:Uncharacterized protein n=1 Tax=Tothia fuscella TaxID=1048955 RepID=A0A9P4U0Q8_9PEZI|nr:hypothetical protein EJ08DRAFT_677247 [Tothia fuscella]